MLRMHNRLAVALTLLFLGLTTSFAQESETTPETSKGFTGEESLMINQTGGNTDLKTYAVKSNTAYEWNANKISLKGAYNYGEAADEVSVENWDALLRYDLIWNPKLGYFVSQQAEADRFAGVRRRYNSDIGSQYKFSETEKKKLLAELGYRYTVEHSVIISEEAKKDSRGRVYVMGERNINEAATLSLWVEYLPNFTDSEDWQLSFEPALITSLSKSLSLKTSYLWEYDNLPAAGNLKHDNLLGVSLIAKF